MRTLEVRADLQAIRALGPWLRAAFAGRQDADDLVGRLELPAHEVLVNVVRHSGLPEDAVIRLRLAEGVDDVRLTVDDDGPFVDLTTAPVAVPGGEPQVHGYGLAIVRSLVDDFTHERRGGGNRWRLTLRTRPTPTEDADGRP